MSRSGHEKGDKKGTRLSKTTPSYWARRVRQRSGASDYSVRIKSARRDYWFNLGTSIKDLAARKALEIYLQVKANGADSAVAEYKAPTRSSDVQTVGGYLEAVGSLGLIKAKTFKDYVNGFQTIVSEIKGFPADKSRFDYKGGGNAAWRSRINAVQLSSITPEAVRKWQRARVSAAGNDNTAVKTAKRTTNSLMVSARSLFSKKIIFRLRRAGVFSLVEKTGGTSGGRGFEGLKSSKKLPISRDFLTQIEKNFGTFVEEKWFFFTR